MSSDGAPGIVREEPDPFTERAISSVAASKHRPGFFGIPVLDAVPHKRGLKAPLYIALESTRTTDMRQGLLIDA